MPQQILPFTAVQPGLAKRIEFPLHPQTVSPEHVGGLLEAVLDALSGQISARGQVSDGDVLQALSMALAIRMHMVAAPIETVQPVVAELLAGAEEAVAASVPEPAGKA